jgi:hypothetical protein
MGAGAIGGGGSQNGAVALSKGSARMGIRCHVQRATIPSKGYFPFFLKLNSCIILGSRVTMVANSTFELKKKLSKVYATESLISFQMGKFHCIHYNGHKK